MAGHSKWANIKHRKGAQDAKRGQVFTKLIREITVSARQSPDPESNPRLRMAIDKALDQNMAKDTIQKAINKGAGLDGAVDLAEVIYEGYGPNGVAFVLECATDNKNRTVSEIRHYFSKAGGSLATSGAVSYLFDDMGMIEITNNGSFDAIFEAALELGAQDVREEEDAIVVQTEPQDVFRIAQELKKTYPVKEVNLTKMPQNTVPYEEELAAKIEALYEKFDEHDDVQKVYCNFEWES